MSRPPSPSSRGHAVSAALAPQRANILKGPAS